MTRKRKRKINAVARPVHPGRTIYTAILSAKMSVGEAANLVSVEKTHLAKIMRGEARLTPQVAYLLSEIFGWERAARWWWMQGKCDMYKAAVSVRSARRALGEIDKADQDGELWERGVAETWREMEVDDAFDEKLNPSIKREDIIGTYMKEDLKDAGPE